nr:transposase [Actinoplanes toevensis]
MSTLATKKELKDLVASTSSRLQQLHGIGPSGAARLLGDIGDITRFASRAHFASWNGTSPRRMWRRRGCSRRSGRWTSLRRRSGPSPVHSQRTRRRSGLCVDAFQVPALDRQIRRLAQVTSQLVDSAGAAQACRAGLATQRHCDLAIDSVAV